MPRSLFFDGMDEAIDDDFQLDGDLGLLSGARAVYRVHVDWNSRGYDRSDAESVRCELVRLEATQTPHGRIMDRAAILNAFGLAAGHRAENSAEDELMERFKTGVAA